MDALFDQATEIINEILLVQDRDVSITLTIEQLKDKYDHIALLVGEYHSSMLALIEKDLADEEKIRNQFKRVDAMCKGVFKFLDVLVA